MNKIFIISILITLLNAANPKPYAVLGDTIYNNVSKIKRLKELSAYKLYDDDINKYLLDVVNAKAIGYQVENNPTKKMSYLTTLRKLSKKNDYYMRSIDTIYKSTLQQNDFKLFSEIINGHFIDTNAHKQEITDYYFLHQKDINSSGIIDKFLEEDAVLKARKEAERKCYKTKKQLQEEKIKRIRANDKANQERIEKELEKQLERKKLKIREEEKKELAN